MDHMCNSLLDWVNTCTACIKGPFIAIPDPLGGRLLQAAHDLQGRLPLQPPQVQVRATTVPPQCVPLRHRVPVAAG